MQFYKGLFLYAIIIALAYLCVHLFGYMGLTDEQKENFISELKSPYAPVCLSYIRNIHDYPNLREFADFKRCLREVEANDIRREVYLKSLK